MTFTMFVFIFFLFSDDCQRLSGFASNFPYSFYVYDLVSNKELAKCNEDMLLIPASTLKLVTSAYAFEKLGKDFRFKTEVSLLSKSSSYAEILLIKGGGDFTLGSENFSSSYFDVAQRIVNLIKGVGIKKLGKVILENKYFSFPHGSVEWQDIGNYYATSVSFFSINDNSYKIYFRSFEENKPVEILKIIPNIGLKFINNVYAASPSSGDNAYIYATPYSTFAVILGTIPSLKEEFVVKGAIFRPDIFFADYFCSFIKENGIDVEGCRVDEEVIDSKDVVLIDTIYSPTLSDIIKVMNKKSFNLYADSLLHFSLIKESKIGFDFNLEELTKFLNTNSIKNFRIVDGSGISRRNLFSSKNFVKLLSYVYRKEYFNEFYSSLPYHGDNEARSSAKIFRVDKADEIRIKSGSMSGVRSWCGYLKKGKKLYAFSFIFNNYLETSSVIQKAVEDYLSKLID